MLLYTPPMTLRFFKYIAMLAIVFVLMGHHVLQVHAMHHEAPASTHHMACDDSCEEEHTSMNICEQIQNDEMQIQLDFSILPLVDTDWCTHATTQTYTESTHHFVSSSPPIDHQQLARSHLSK